MDEMDDLGEKMALTPHAATTGMSTVEKTAYCTQHEIGIRERPDKETESEAVHGKPGFRLAVQTPRKRLKIPSFRPSA